MTWVLIVWLCAFNSCSPLSFPEHLSEELCYDFREDLLKAFPDSERTIRQGVCISKFDGNVIGE